MYQWLWGPVGRGLSACKSVCELLILRCTWWSFSPDVLDLDSLCGDSRNGLGCSLQLPQKHPSTFAAPNPGSGPRWWFLQAAARLRVKPAKPVSVSWAFGSSALCLSCMFRDILTFKFLPLALQFTVLNSGKRFHSLMAKTETRGGVSVLMPLGSLMVTCLPSDRLRLHAPQVCTLEIWILTFTKPLCTLLIF